MFIHGRLGDQEERGARLSGSLAWVHARIAELEDKATELQRTLASGQAALAQRLKVCTQACVIEAVSVTSTCSISGHTPYC